MIRKVSLAAVVLTFGLVIVGCNNSPPQNTVGDSGIKGSQGVDKKGNKQKTMEAGSDIEPRKK